MATDRARNRQLRLRLAAAIAVIVLFTVTAVRRSSGSSATTTVLEIAAALVVVAVIVVVLMQRMRTDTSSALQDIRGSEPVSFPCYFDNGKRGIVSIRGGDLVVRRFRGRSLVEDAQLPVGTYSLVPSTVQLTAARRVDGVMVTTDGTSGLRLALSHDRMTMLGNLLTGAELERAMASLQPGAPSAPR